MGNPARTYSIGEMSREFGVTPRALRFYEDRGLIAPWRDGMNRIYTARDRGRLKLIVRGKRAGFSLVEIKEMLDLYDLDTGHKVQAKVAVKKFRARLAALERKRADLEEAMQDLRDAIALMEQRAAAPDPPDSSGLVRAAAHAFDREARRRLPDALDL